MKSHSTGSVLAISLVLLTAITLIAIMSIQRSGLQTKITANLQHQETAFNLAQDDLKKAYRDAQRGKTQFFSDAINSPNTDIVIDTEMSKPNPLYKAVTVTRHIPSSLATGMPVTSSLRDNNSRGKNGAGIEKFEIESISAFSVDMSSDPFTIPPTGISSNHRIRIAILPEQI